MRYLTLRRINAPPIGWPYPVLHERHEEAGKISGHYFHQDLWAARLIKASNPARHVDIGSRIDGFVAHLLVFREVEVVDVRPLRASIKGLHFIQDDAITLAGFPDDSLPSMSCLHAAEHFGLGRYGDPIDPEAPFKFLNSVQRVLAPGGRFYFSVPCGRERVEFNAHRIFAPETVLNALDQLRLVEFAAVLDNGGFRLDLSPTDLRGQRYACGLFVFERSM